MKVDASLAHMVRHWSRVRPHATAITVGGRGSLTYRELDELTSRFANGLRALGVGTGQRVAFLGRDTRTWATALVGASKVRAAGAPLNWRLARPEMAEILADAEPAVIVCEPRLLPLLGLPAGAPGDGDCLVVDGVATPLRAWLDEQSPLDPGGEPEPEDIAFLFYTSGTTGRPKGVQLANRSVSANLAKTAPWTIGPDDVVFVPAPTFHLSGSGWLFLCLARGAHALYVNEVVPAEVLRLFETHCVTHALVVPAVLQMLAREPVASEVDYSALKMIIYGGSPISTTVLGEAREVFGCALTQSYGMTESNGPITFLWPADHAPDAPVHRLTSAGRPVDGVEVAVYDPVAGERLPSGQVGEVWTRSDLLMTGYRNRPDEQRAAVTGDGWLRTGDAGYFDDDGYLYITDRVKDMIVSGAENIYPAEVENALMEHPDVADAAVVGVPHEKWGETVKAVVVARPGAALEAGQIIDYCRGQLAHYKCPTTVDIVDDLPRNPSGKILKRVLRERYWPTSGRRVG